MLRDLDLTIEAGERVLLVGPSGSGKSTLLRALAGLLETADAGELSGTVTLDGVAPGDRPGSVGLVLQEPGAGVVAATVARDVAFGPENVGMPRAEMPGRVASALAAVRLAPDRGAVADPQVLPASGVDEVAGLGGAAGAWPTSALSGGQTQRLALAGALALEPSLLLLDEPTAMLDAENAQSVRAAVDEVVTARGLTLVVVEHLLGPWVDLVDRLVVLDEDGGVVADGPVRKTLASEGERLLAMGVWVPGAAAPTPIEVDPALVARASTRHTESALAATELTVARTTRTVDGVATTRVAARTSEPLVVGAGQLHALVGPSGSGKSTILHALAGFLTPTTGRVETGAGAVVADLDPAGLAAHVAWVPQWSSSTVVARTVLDEVLVTAQALGRLDAGSETRARALLDVLGLGPLASADPRQLSGGEQRRLAVAAALFHGPELVLADEPTVGQDRHTWAAVVGLLAAYRSGGGAIVTATHDAHVITRAGDRVHRLTAPPSAPGPRGGEPLLAGRGPLALLLGSALAVPAGVLSPGWRPSLVLLGIQLVLAVSGLVSVRAGVIAPLRALLTRLVPGLLAAVSVAWSTWLLGGRDLALAGNGLTRVLLIVLPSAVLLPFIDTDRLGDQLAQTLHLPDRPVVAVSAAMHRMQSFGQIWEEIARARRIRGLAATWRRPATIVGHVLALTIGLLLRALRSAAELAVAMDARGFARAQRRTWFHPARWTWGDTALVALSALPAVVAVAFAVAGR
ncbi:MAG: ATP-binding cassette domain-containing protein [Dermatophilaceae bacterium]